MIIFTQKRLKSEDRNMSILPVILTEIIRYKPEKKILNLFRNYNKDYEDRFYIFAIVHPPPAHLP
jgi:hypothetical protein